MSDEGPTFIVIDEEGGMPAKTTPQLDDLTNPYGYSEMDWAAQLDHHAPPAEHRHAAASRHAAAAHGHLPAESSATGHPPAGHHRDTLTR
jgi:hypothetical protein